MREEWDKRIQNLAEAVDISLDDELVTPELKVIHKDSRIKYTIDSIGPRDVILRTPEGEKFLVGREELEQDYALE